MKNARVTISDAAITDILEQADWYERQADKALASRWDEAVTSTLLNIVAFPHTGSRCSFQARRLGGIRRMPVLGFHKHLVFYRALEGEIFVLRVIHGARDLDSLF